MQPEVNFVGGNVSQSDKELFLGPITDQDGPFIKIGEGWSLAHVMHAAGAFPSIGQAKKNGWDKPLPVGFESYTVGKRKLNVYVLTSFD